MSPPGQDPDVLLRVLFQIEEEPVEVGTVDLDLNISRPDASSSAQVALHPEQIRDALLALAHEYQTALEPQTSETALLGP